MTRIFFHVTLSCTHSFIAEHDEAIIKRNILNAFFLSYMYGFDKSDLFKSVAAFGEFV